MGALAAKPVSREDLDEIKRMIEAAEKGRRRS
jgi:hypothetical protein